MLGEKNVSHLRRFGFLVGDATQCSRTGLVYAAPPALGRRYWETSGPLLDEEPTLCKEQRSTELRGGPSVGLRAGMGAAPGVNYVLRVRVKDVSRLRRLALFMCQLPSAYPSILLRAGALG